MFYLIYVSSASELLSESELAQLLKTSRENNLAYDITGMLLYKGGSFMQLLEGDESTVVALFNEIKKDPRNKDVLEIMRGDTRERLFSDWSMGFANMDHVDGLPSYSEYFDQQLSLRSLAEDATQAYRFIQVFNSINR